MIQWVQHSSKAIKGFPMGDAHERKFPVYLPSDYNPKRSDPYPVIFMLAGWSGRGSHYLQEENIFTPSLDQKIDALIQKKEMNPVIIVFPDGSSKLGCSQYVNSASNGMYTDYICDELTSFIDSNFHTHKSADFRGVMGHSSGGFGALVFANLRPDAFKYICSSAGDSFFKFSLMLPVSSTCADLDRSGGIEKFVKDFLNHPSPGSAGRSQFETMMTLSLASCYAPNPKVPVILGDLFFDWKTGALIPELWQKYSAWDPIEMADKNSDRLRSLKHIHLACGISDNYGPQWGHRQLASKLSAWNIPHELEEYPGGHSGQRWRFAERIQKMVSRMES